MSMEDFGILSLLLGYSAFLFYVFTLGSFQYLFKCVSKGEEAKRSGVWSTLCLTGIISSFAVIITFLFSKQLCNYLNIRNYETEFILTVLATATTSIMMVFLFYHYGLGRNNFQNLLQFLRGSLWVILSIFIALFMELTLKTTLIIFNIAIFITLLISIPWKELISLAPISLKIISLKPVFKYCLPLLPYFAAVWGIPAIVRTQLNIESGPKDVALFNVAYSLIDIIFMFISTIAGTLSPHFFADDGDASKPALLFNVMMKYSVLLVVLIIPFVYITRYDIILLLTSKNYAAAGDYIPLLILLPFFRILIIVFEQAYLKESKTLFLGVAYTLAILFTLLFSAILIPKYSILGAIYTALGAYFLLFIGLSIKQVQKVDYKYQNLFAVLGLISIIWSSVFLVDLLRINGFLKALPVALVACIGLFTLPVLSTWEREKILSLIKIRNVSK